MPAAPTIRNTPLVMLAVRPRTVFELRPLIGPSVLELMHDASAPGALCSAKSVDSGLREVDAAAAWRILNIPAETVADCVLPPAPIRRPSTVEATASLPLRASTTVPIGSDAWPFKGTKPEIGAVCLKERTLVVGSWM